MISLTEAQELHELVGYALEETKSGHTAFVAELERARELAALIVSDLLAQPDTAGEPTWTTGLYQAIAEHVSEGRAPDIDCQGFREWLASIDSGGDATWEKIDDALDELVERYREAR